MFVSGKTSGKSFYKIYRVFTVIFLFCIALSLSGASLLAEGIPANEEKQSPHRLSFSGGYAFIDSTDADLMKQASQMATEVEKNTHGGFAAELSYGYRFGNFMAGASAAATSVFDYDYKILSAVVQLYNSIFPLQIFARYHLPFGFYAGLGAGYAYYLLTGVANEESVEETKGGPCYSAHLGYEYRISSSFSVSLSGRYVGYQGEAKVHLFAPAIEFAWHF